MYGLSDNEAAYLAGSMFGAGSDTVSLLLIQLYLMLIDLDGFRHQHRCNGSSLLPRDRDKSSCPNRCSRGYQTMFVYFIFRRILLLTLVDPTFDDRDQLTEVTAFVLETYRWYASLHFGN